MLTKLFKKYKKYTRIFFFNNHFKLDCWKNEWKSRKFVNYFVIETLSNVKLIYIRLEYLIQGFS